MDAPPEVKVGDVIRKRWKIQKLLGEGGCGVVYLVQNTKKDGPEGQAAMKIEPITTDGGYEGLLKLEVMILKRLKKSRHACKLLLACKTKTYACMVISLLGKSLHELRKTYPSRVVPLHTGIKIGLQSLQGIQDLHVAGFVHRDIKPANFALGTGPNKSTVYLFDFGLARQIILEENGKQVLRTARTKVLFRGTKRFCSINVHQRKEQGRHDDLISWIYMLIELLTRKLPWDGLAPEELEKLKETISDKELFAKCPSSFASINKSLKKLSYTDVPPYDEYREQLQKELATAKTKADKASDQTIDEQGNTKESVAKTKESQANTKETQSEEIKGSPIENPISQK